MLHLRAASHVIGQCETDAFSLEAEIPGEYRAWAMQYLAWRCPVMNERGYDPLADYRIEVESQGEIECHKIIWDGGRVQRVYLPDGFDLSIRRRWIETGRGVVSEWVGKCHERLKCLVREMGGFHNTVTPEIVEQALKVTQNRAIYVMDRLVRAGLAANGSRYRQDYTIFDKNARIKRRSRPRPEEARDVEDSGS